MTTVSELRNHRELFSNLTLRELRGKYKRSALGWGWSMINPIAQMAIFSLVFSFFLRIEPPVGDPSGLHVFAFFLLCGLLPWTFLANGITNGMGSLLANANLVKKVWFPRQVLVGSIVASFGVSFLIELAVLSVALLLAGNMVLPWLLPVAGIAAIQAAFVLGMALALSVCSVYFRDLEYLVGIGLQIWFYSTPIVYPIRLVEEALEDRPLLLSIYELNPMTRFAEVYRDLFYSLRMPSAASVGYLIGCAAMSLVIGWVVFNRLEGRLAEEL
ncbi:MAG: ABC transporter permease [Acidimicrobiales bacterium]